MSCLCRLSPALVMICFVVGVNLSAEQEDVPEGFTSLFNGKDFSGWKVPDGDAGVHWKVIDGVMDHDGRTEEKGEKDHSLWTDKSYKDFVLLIDWKLKTDPGYRWSVPILLPDGSNKKDADGNDVKVEIEDVDSGIYLRGSSKSQVNIWMWPAGSGEVWGYRTDEKMPAEVRAAATPKKKADKPRGQWNTFEITLKRDRLWVKLNGEEVISNAQLPGIPEEGPIALQHHGIGYDEGSGKWKGPPSLVQFRNIFIKELKPE
jgi:hypothetical protein